MSRIVKRIIDILIAAVALILALPLLGACAAAIRLTMGSPVFFTQVRTGRRGRLFGMTKFRTMSFESDGRGSLLPDEQRLTRLGALLRRTSLDELPELWQVLKGDMSLVGPRPLLPEYVPRYTPDQRRRHNVKPGITGWAQVNGRNAIGWEEKLSLDVWYVDHQSLWLDLQILLKTPVAVLRCRGIAHEGHATMPSFAAPATTESRNI